jgi:hypothetical protein
MRDCEQCQGNPRKEVRVKTFSDGRPQYCYQCLDCGLRVGTWLGKSHPDVLALAERVPFDEEAEDAYHERRRQFWEQKRLERQAEYEAQIAAREEAARQRQEQYTSANAEWWAHYNAYLLTPTWRAKRALVMARAGNMCEGCRQRYATQVHHLTYAHVFEEFLWELVAVCDACHSRVHSNREADHAA